MDQLIEGLTLHCPIDGEQTWQGDVFCKCCSTIYVCTGIEETGEFNEKGEPKKKYVYPESPPKGVCSCGKRLFGGTDFTARPMCHLCAVRVTTRKAAERGEFSWVPDPDEHDGTGEMIDPDGHHTYMLGVFQHGSAWHWEVSFPSGHCSGDEKTKEEARSWAEKIYLAIIKIEEKKTP